MESAKQKKKTKRNNYVVSKNKEVESSENAIKPGQNWKNALATMVVKRGNKRKNDLVYTGREKSRKIQKRTKSLATPLIDTSTIIAMDCEMVGVGIGGNRSVLARCSIVDYDGNVLYDKTVRPIEKVTDFRTHVSGIRARSLRDAISFRQCLDEVGPLFKDKVVVGHSLKNDFKALMFDHKKEMIRDTATYRPYMRQKTNGTKLYPRSLKDLTKEVLKKTIQEGEHDSVEDARCALELYKREEITWEKNLKGLSKNSSRISRLIGEHPNSRQ